MAATMVQPSALPAAAPAPAPLPSPACGEFTCTACADAFANAAEFRAHSKSERHVYNTKRKLASLKPISQEAWDRKLREARGSAGASNKGTAHLKPGKEKEHKRSTSELDGQATPSQAASEAGASEGGVGGGAVKKEFEEEPASPRRSLFDRKHFGTVGENLEYMRKTYSFFVPDRDYVTDLEGLLLFLRKKISEPPHACLCCNRPFPDLASVRRHMIDKCHTRIGTEAFTRRGNIDKRASNMVEAELEDYYDFHGSIREVMARFKPVQKIASLLRYFDSEGEGVLRKEGLANLWAAASDGAELSDAQYLGACSLAGIDPKVGLDAEDLGKLYKGGLADLDIHFAMLTEKLSVRKPKPETADDEDEAAAADGAEQELEAVKEEADDDDDEEGSDEESGSEVDVIECEDEDEFEDVMRTLGLQSVDITEGGDLRLPNGNIATNRDMGYIFKQRGPRMDTSLVLASGRHPKRRSQLMLSNGTAAGTTSIAMSHREEVREGKKVIAVMRTRQKYEMKLGMHRNLLQNNRNMKTVSVRGDMSGAGGAGR